MIARLLTALVLSAAIGAGAYYAYSEAIEPFKGYAGDEVFVTIAPGEASSAIAETLQTTGGLGFPWLANFRRSAFGQVGDGDRSGTP